MRIDLERHAVFRLADRTVSISVFFILLLTYWLTVPPTVSFWDCPEYVMAAYRLEVGHPPGNPFWMLVERVVTMFAAPEYVALAVNLSSGLFTALAGMLLAKCIFIGAVWVLKTRDGRRRRLHAFYAAGAAFLGALSFGWCDSAWFSAVEAEVYAMSIFLTVLSLWLMMKWARAHDRSLAWRYLILLAYVFGLSLGVHQLNLLVIPALAFIWALRREIHSPWKILLAFLLGIAAVGCILEGMMPSTIALAAAFELFAVNTIHVPYLWGVAAYVLLLGLTLIIALVATSRSTNRGLLSLAIFPPVFLSGIFIVADQFFMGLAISLLASILIVRISYFKPYRLNMMMWMLAMLLTGYSCYALIPIRGDIPAPPNAALPGEPFSFAAYQAREQYGAAPLLYGETPYSKPLYIETFSADSTPRYSRYKIKHEHRILERLQPDARLPKLHGASALSREDSLLNLRALEHPGNAYVVKGYRSSHVLTPELNMWFPRITSRDPRDLKAFESWVGMTPETMTEVRISEAVDSDGNFVPKLDAFGKRTEPVSYRPTYLQNFQYMGAYQVGYMYMRYLMWNFSGRQNDIPSTGEVEHGNFITGFMPLDNAMLEAEDALPDHAGKDNPGRNRYYLLPFILGIIGIVWLLRSNWRGRIACAVIAVLFVMTGLAIVVYLNQSPGEPRERDYTFLGSYMAFAMWIGAGALAFARTAARFTARHLRRNGRLFRNGSPRIRTLIIAAAIGFIPPAVVMAILPVENFDDHDRSDRRAASNLARNLLNSLDRDAVIFVEGDNYTFPLWYAQEVEGMRRDVRVINLSYLTNPKYASLVLREWNGTKPLNSVLREPDLIYNAFSTPTAEGKRDSVADALDMLNALRLSYKASTLATAVSFTLPSGEHITLPITRITRTPTSSTLEFRRLMMLDIIVSNISGENPRPIYWQKALAKDRFLGLLPYLTDDVFAYRLGSVSTDRQCEKIISLSESLLPPNGRPDAYMDETPATQVARQRADLTAAARLLLRNGHPQEAERLARFTLSTFGHNPYSYSNVWMGDTVFITAREFGSLFRELGDSLSSPELSASGDSILKADETRRMQWERYRRTLSPRMRLNMSGNP